MKEYNVAYAVDPATVAKYKNYGIDLFVCERQQWRESARAISLYN